MSVQKQFFAPLLFLPCNNKKPADDDDGVTANETQTVLQAHQNQNPSLLEEGFQVRDWMKPRALAEKLSGVLHSLPRMSSAFDGNAGS
jgi:hypothetical protein